MRKETSTNLVNEKRLNRYCGIAYTLQIIGGRWKASILSWLISGKMRYNELRRSIPDVSERILVLQLRELERDGVIKRIVHPEVPPRVEYELTELGKSMRPILKVLSEWGETIVPTDPHKRGVLPRVWFVDFCHQGISFHLHRMATKLKCLNCPDEKQPRFIQKKFS